MQKIRLITLLLLCLTLVLAGCGGTTSPDDDHNNAGSDNGNAGPGDNSPVLAAGISLLANSTDLPSDSAAKADGAQITAIVSDDDRNVLEGQDVSFAANSGSLQVTRKTTDASGSATAVLTTGGNPRNRPIRVTARAGDQRDSVTVEVVGTQLALAGPSALSLRNSDTYTAHLTDAGGNGIANQTVMVSSARGNTLSMNNPQTDRNGQAQLTLTAGNPGQDTLTARALGLTATTPVQVSGDSFQLTAPTAEQRVPLNTTESVTLRWTHDGRPTVGRDIQFTTTRGQLTPTSDVTDRNGVAAIDIRADNAGPATITATSANDLQTSVAIQFIATQPAAIDIQADPATVAPEGQSQIKAIVRDRDNNLVTDTTVNFSLDDASGGSLADGRVTTDTDGVASTTYTAGSTSASQPASITATVSGEPGISQPVSVAIGGQALRIALGTGNKLMTDNPSTYQLPYVAVVTDANGNPAPNATFRLQLLSVAYQKGKKTLVDMNEDGASDRYEAMYAVDQSREFGDGCANEDSNDNGVLNSGEDINGNGMLEPGNIASVSSTASLDADGIAQFNITYPRNYSQWVRVRLRAIASVQGTETTSDAVFVLPVLADDVNDAGTMPPGQISPFGTASNCTNPD